MSTKKWPSSLEERRESYHQLMLRTCQFYWWATYRHLVEPGRPDPAQAALHANGGPF